MVLYVDLVGSTKMALEMPSEKIATIISSFAQEMAAVIRQHHGYVLKFVGGAVIGYFVAESNSCLLYTAPSPRDRTRSRMPSSA